MAPIILKREDKLRDLNAVVTEAIAGEGWVALVSGIAGIGKTIMVDDFPRERRDTVRVLWGTCDVHFTPRPLGPLCEIARQAKIELLTLLSKESPPASNFVGVYCRAAKSPDHRSLCSHPVEDPKAVTASIIEILNSQES